MGIELEIKSCNYLFINSNFVGRYYLMSRFFYLNPLLRYLTKFSVKVIASTSLILPLLLGCGSSKSLEADPVNSLEVKAASQKEMDLYRNIGMRYLCIAREADVEFSKAIAIASTNFTDIIDKRHGGLILEVGQDKLTLDQIYSGTYFQLVEGAIQLCPDKVPEEIKAKYKDAVQKFKNLKQ